MESIKKPSLSFQITNSEEFFNKLLQEYSEFDKEHLNPRHAINCSITSWHLTDWTYHEFHRTTPEFQDKIKVDKKGCIKKISGLTKYQQHLTKICPELEYMKLIANGSKHCILNDSAIKNKTEVRKGDFSTDFSRHDFHVSRFVIRMNKDETIDFEKVF